METKEYTTIDRKALDWPSGPWDSEPDKVQWQDSATGMPCLAKRHTRYGHWCGYVGLTKDHPLFGKTYHDVNVEVHGGLTYSDECDGGDESVGICHVPSANESNHVWWLGFDCGHAWDYSPYDLAQAERGYPFGISHYQTYKTLSYVQRNCAELAKQLDELRRAGL